MIWIRCCAESRNPETRCAASVSPPKAQRGERCAPPPLPESASALERMKPAQDAQRAGALRPAQANGRAGVGIIKVGAALPAVPAARLGGGAWGVVVGNDGPEHTQNGNAGRVRGRSFALFHPQQRFHYRKHSRRPPFLKSSTQVRRAARPSGRIQRTYFILLRITASAPAAISSTMRAAGFLPRSMPAI